MGRHRYEVQFSGGKQQTWNIEAWGIDHAIELGAMHEIHFDRGRGVWVESATVRDLTIGAAVETFRARIGSSAEGSLICARQDS